MQQDDSAGSGAGMTAPPSPIVMCLDCWNEKQPMSPIVPQIRPSVYCSTTSKGISLRQSDSRSARNGGAPSPR